jgi:hypothetical protein
MQHVIDLSVLSDRLYWNVKYDSCLCKFCLCLSGCMFQFLCLKTADDKTKVSGLNGNTYYQNSVPQLNKRTNNSQDATAPEQ